MLLGTFATIEDHPDVQAMWDGALATLVDPVDPALVREFQESTLATADSTGAARHLRRREPQGAGARMAGDIPRVPRPRLLAESRRITAPTLVIWGDKDAFVDRAGSRSAGGGIPRAAVVDYPAFGHAMHWEDPARVAAEVARFVGELPAAQAGRTK